MTEEQWRTLDGGYMRMAIAAAVVAERQGDRPFGCVVVSSQGGVIGEGRGTGIDTDPTRHSEIRAIKQAALRTRGELGDCTIYSTHEPCTMCCGAIMHAKIGRVVWGSERSDLPQLFRQQEYAAVDLLRNTSQPPVWRIIMNDECVALFANELASLKEPQA